MIKDSGERTEFTTGAVRDMHAGKGRMDLLPLTAIIELSKHCEEGAGKYGEHNIDKGIPQHSLCDSGLNTCVVMRMKIIFVQPAGTLCGRLTREVRTRKWLIFHGCRR